MGYYSDVAFATTKEGWETIKHNVKQASPDNYKYIVGDEHTHTTKNGYIVLLLHSVKWYDDWFPEVDAFMQTLKEFDKENIPYSYLRSGEDYGDVQRLEERDFNKDPDLPEFYMNKEIEVEEF